MGAIERATNENVIANADRETLAGWVEELEAEIERLREALHRINSATNSELGMVRLIAREALATASLAVFICSRCRESVDTVYEVGSGANVEHVCVTCVDAGGDDE